MTLVIGYVLWRDIVSAYRFNLASVAEYRQMEQQLAMHLRTTTELAGQIERHPETEELRRELLRYLEDFPAVLA